MASKKMLLVLAIVVTALPAIAMATQHVVGGADGWKPGFNYTLWAQGKEFMVGDTLVFNYPSGKHNVIKVGGADFQACNATAGSAPLTTGNDEITLSSPGRKWYICGFGNHCVSGQKLVITVQSDLQAPTIAPAPNSSYKISRSIFQNLMLALVAMGMSILI